MQKNETDDGGRQRILIVDDTPANLGVLHSVLQEAGYDVLFASNGESALARLVYMQPDIILLDINMPGADGYEVCRRLKADSAWRDTPVLFLTALGDPVDKVRGFDVGAVDYITKPLHPKEVLARVRAHLQIRSLQIALADKNALLETAMARRQDAEAQLQQSLDRAVIVVYQDGEIQFCTRLARLLLQRYFPAHKETDTLPSTLLAWATGGADSDMWRSEGQEAWLEIQLFARGRPGACFMMLLEEGVRTTNSPGRLLGLGLTAREAEVLFWAAQGKNNPEVAIILQVSHNTVRKHVANILVKLGVESRLAAALNAAELLGLTVAKPGLAQP